MKLAGILPISMLSYLYLLVLCFDLLYTGSVLNVMRIFFCHTYCAESGNLNCREKLWAEYALKSIVCHSASSHWTLHSIEILMLCVWVLSEPTMQWKNLWHWANIKCGFLHGSTGTIEAKGNQSPTWDCQPLDAPPWQRRGTQRFVCEGVFHSIRYHHVSPTTVQSWLGSLWLLSVLKSQKEP